MRPPSFSVSLLPSARGFGPALERETSGPISSAGKKAGKLFAAGIVAATAVVGASLAEAMEQQKDTGRMAAALGLSPSESKELGKVAGKLYANAYGESFGEVTDAVGAVRSSIAGMADASSADIEKITAKALDFAGTFEVDVARSTQVVGQLLTTGLAKDATQAFDLITAASQRVPANVREDVIDAADEYGQFFATLGFSGEQAFSILVEGSKKGMFGIDKAGDAIKEFTIRATDMSTTSQEAYAAIGLNAGQMANDILAGGDKASAATQSILDGLLALPPGADQANAAIALFGTPLEDLSVTEIPQFLESLKGGSDAMDGFAGASDRMGKALNDNASTNLTAFKRQVTQTFVNLVGGTVLPYVSSFASMLATGFAPAMETARRVAIQGYEAFMAFASSAPAQAALAVVMDTLRSVAGSLVSAWGHLVNAGATLYPVLVDVWSSIQPGVLAAGVAAFAALNVAVKVAGKVVKVAAAVIAGIVATFVAWQDVLIPVAAGIAAMVLAVKGYQLAVAAALLVQRAFTAALIAGRTAVMVAQGAIWLMNLALAANPIGIVVLALIGLGAALVVAWKKSETFRNVVLGAWEAIRAGTVAVFGAIKSSIEWAMNAVKTVFTFYLNGFELVWGTIFGAIKKGVELYMKGVKLYIETVVGAIHGVFNGMRSLVGLVVGFFISIKDGIVNQWNTLIGFLTGLPGRVTSALGGMWNVIEDGFKSALNTIIGWWNNFSLTIDIPDAIPGLPNEWTIRTPNIPMLAEGGIVRRPTLAVVGEAGPEAVVPLPRLGEFAQRAQGAGEAAGLSRADLENMRIEVTLGLDERTQARLYLGGQRYALEIA